MSLHSVSYRAAYAQYPAASSTAAKITSSTPLSVSLAGEGKLVFLKPLIVSGTNPDRSPTYIRNVIYQGAGAATHPDKFSCIATFSTTYQDNSSIDYAPGKSAVFVAGDAIPFLTDMVEEARFEKVANVDGTVDQWINLSFNSLATQLMTLSCNATTAADAVLTVGDFEAATDGIMTLR